jgi:hydrogenase nickel incorporation protein HypA/HybF
MHELAICQQLVARVADIACENHAAVTGVRVGIGPLSGVEPALIERAYPLACAGTAAEGSTLAIEAMPVEVRCRDCQARTRAGANRLLCGACGSWRTDLASGDELLLLKVELAREVTAHV